jgi:KDO2-lipid IV(A) lauroyltransferase
MARRSLRLLFACARCAPWLVRLLRRPAMLVLARYSASVRCGTRANARRIFVARELTSEQYVRFTEEVVGRFCDFVLDVATGSTATAEQLRHRIDSIEGRERYLTRRRAGDGAIIITAHMGSFEVGLAALARVEPSIHVVFKRDEFSGFELIRGKLRKALGVREAPIDDGWATWLRLRDALRANDVVVFQADRALPGQKSQIVPMLGGHIRLPLGPVKLAAASGSPIVPIFTIVTAPGRYRIFIEEPIDVCEDTSLVVAKIGTSIEKFVAAYPDQWLVLYPAFVEDEPAEKSTRA